MTSYIPERWAIIEVGATVADLTLATPSRAAAAIDAVQLGSDLATLVEGLPLWRDGPHGNGPVPLAVFVRLRTGEPAPAHVLAELSRQIAERVDPDRFQLVRLGQADHSIDRAPFQLPLRVLAVGDGARVAIAHVASRPWLLGAQFTSEFGLSIRNAGTDELLETLRYFPADIVIVVEGAEAVASAFASLPPEQQPRVLVVASPHFSHLVAPSAFPACSMLVLEDDDPQATQALANAIIYGVIHDLPLHEVLKSGKRELPKLDDEVMWLISTPHANNDLRMMSALVALRDRAIELEAEFGWYRDNPYAEKTAQADDDGGGDDELLSLSFGEEADSDPFETADQTYLHLAGVERILQNTRADFAQEQSGLLPLAQACATLAAAEGEIQLLRARLSELGPSEVAELRQRQRRRVDIALQRVQAYAPFIDVAPECCLARGRSYRIRLHIGNPLPGSIVTGNPQEIDELLPSRENGHRLQVAVQPKTFGLTSPAVQDLFLPHAGGSKPVYFSVTAPDAIGDAALRVTVHHENHLLQAFLVSAYVDEDERIGAGGDIERIKDTGRALEATLECARTERFTNLETLPPRALYIGANKTGGTHELSIKGTNGKDDVTLTPAAFAEQMQQFRQILHEATWQSPGKDQPRDFPIVEPGKPIPAEYAQYMRRLARKGRDLYNRIFQATSSVQLKPVREGRGSVIQVVRYEPEFAFPWVALYDFDLPRVDSEPVCPGLQWDAKGNSSPCAHGPNDRVFCANGFWGVRHVIEELVARSRKEDSEPSIECSAQAPVVGIAANLGLPAVDWLFGELHKSIPSGRILKGPDDDTKLLDLLWDKPTERPPILVVLAHLEEGEATYTNEPVDSRIVLVNKDKWLTEQQLAERYQAADRRLWAQPRALIMLMVCQSAIGATTSVNSFANTLSLAGALGVVGTECTVFSELASRFAADLTLALWQGEKTVGQAMTEVRRKLIAEGNPLGFVFHCIGGADVRLVWGST